MKRYEGACKCFVDSVVHRKRKPKTCECNDGDSFLSWPNIKALVAVVSFVVLGILVASLLDHFRSREISNMASSVTSLVGELEAASIRYDGLHKKIDDFSMKAAEAVEFSKVDKKNVDINSLTTFSKSQTEVEQETDGNNESFLAGKFKKGNKNRNSDEDNRVGKSKNGNRDSDIRAGKLKNGNKNGNRDNDNRAGEFINGNKNLERDSDPGRKYGKNQNDIKYGQNDNKYGKNYKESKLGTKKSGNRIDGKDSEFEKNRRSKSQFSTGKSAGDDSDIENNQFPDFETEQNEKLNSRSSVSKNLKSKTDGLLKKSCIKICPDSCRGNAPKISEVKMIEDLESSGKKDEDFNEKRELRTTKISCKCIEGRESRSEDKRNPKEENTGENVRKVNFANEASCCCVDDNTKRKYMTLNEKRNGRRRKNELNGIACTSRSAGDEIPLHVISDFEREHGFFKNPEGEIRFYCDSKEILQYKCREQPNVYRRIESEEEFSTNFKRFRPKDFKDNDPCHPRRKSFY